MAASTRSTSTKKLSFAERAQETSELARDVLKGVTESDFSIRAVAVLVIMEFEDTSLELANTPRDKRPSMPDRVKTAVENAEDFYRKQAGYLPRHLRLGSRLGVDAIYGGGRVSYEESTVEAETAKINQRIADNLERSRIDRENREKAAKVAAASTPSDKPKTRRRSNGKPKGSNPVTMPTPKQSAAPKKRRYTKQTSKAVVKS